MLGDEGINHLYTALKDKTQLQELDLDVRIDCSSHLSHPVFIMQRNEIGDAGIARLSLALEHMKLLEELNLEVLPQTVITPLMPFFGSEPHIQFNNIGYDGARILVRVLRNMTTMKELRLAVRLFPAFCFLLCAKEQQDQ